MTDREEMTAPAPQVWTVGHSTRSAGEFLGLLRAHAIEAVADVRRFPGSRRHPHFGADALAEHLGAHGIAYTWIRELGGRRRSAREAADSAWRNPSFAAYEQHLASDEFAEGLHTLLHVASACRTAIMCSEAVWWRCHRALISDVLRFCGAEVLHITSTAPPRPHPYSSPARVVDGELRYPPADCC